MISLPTALREKSVWPTFIAINPHLIQNFYSVDKLLKNTVSADKASWCDMRSKHAILYRTIASWGFGRLCWAPWPACDLGPLVIPKTSSPIIDGKALDKLVGGVKQLLAFTV